MKPIGMTITNYRAFERADLDLNAVSAAAIVGPNGAGKSTVCEAMLWALFGEGRSSSVDGVVRLGADEAAVELHYHHNGNDYRIIRKRSRGRRSELHYMIADSGAESGFLPLTRPSIRETQARIAADLAMDDSLFLASSCVMQGRSAGICEAGPAERKQILYRILEDRLARFGPLYIAAKSQTAALEISLGRGRTKREELESLVATREAEESFRAGAQDALDNLRADHRRAEAELNAAREREVARQEKINRLTELAGRINELEEEIEGQQRTIEHHQRVIVEKQSLIGDAGRIRKNAAECDRVEVELTEMGQAAAAYRAAWDRYEALDHDIEAEETRLRQEIEHLEREIETAEQQREEYANQAALVDQVPCVGTPFNDECKLLASARSAAARAGECDQKIYKLRTDLKTASAQQKNNTKRQTALDAGQAEIDAIGYDEETHRGLSEVWARLRKSRARLPELAAAETAIAAAAEMVDASTVNRDRASIQLKKLIAERDAIKITDADRNNIAAMTAGLAELASEIEDQVRVVAIRDERLARIDLAQQELEVLAVELDALVAERDTYGALQRAFSRDGIPALIIDAAVPHIEAQANDVLATLSDGRMSLRFETQRLKSTGGIAETLDIIITDAAGERPYEDWSGGEKLRIDLAVRIALGRALAQRTGSKIELLLLDEVCAPLDEAGEDALIDCVTKLQDAFGCILLITHREHLRDRLPQQIVVTKNGSLSHAKLSV